MIDVRRFWPWEGEHGGNAIILDGKKHQYDESRRKLFMNQRKKIYLVNSKFEAWENAKSEADKNFIVTIISPRI